MNPRMIKKHATRFPEAWVFEPVLYTDDRGRLAETFSNENYSQFGIIDSFVQDLVTWSVRNVIRGPHWDDRMAKFIQVLKGEIFDVIIDMRLHSPTYKKWQGFALSAENRQQLYVPKGFAHGFLTRADENIVHYKMSAQHDPAHEHRIHWRDSSVGIEWPTTTNVLVSEKDDAPSPA